MKIKKNVLTEGKKIIIEAEEAKEETLDAIDTEASAEEVGKELAAQADELTDGEVPVDAEEAGDLAKSAAAAIGAKTVVTAPAEKKKRKDIKVENTITRMLDEALDDALYFREEGSSERANVLISGLPGSSKTASVYNWAKHATVDGEPVHISYLNAKNNDLDAYINGYTVQDPDNKLSVTQAVSSNLKDLDRPNSILFLDEYNRQTEDQIRASLLTLINEHYIVGKEEGGKHYFPNFLFTIACMNPPLGDKIDPGAARLNSAETTRFLHTMKNADSDKESTKAYLMARYDDKVDERIEEANESGEPLNMQRVLTYLRIQYLGTYLMESSFEYSREDDARRCARFGTNILNQRIITAGLEASRGDVAKFLNWIKNRGNFAEEEIAIVEEALALFEMPSDDELIEEAEKRGLNIKGTAKQPEPEPEVTAEPESTASAVEAEDDEDIEDDPDFFTGAGKTASGKTLKTPAEAKQAIAAAIASF